MKILITGGAGFIGLHLAKYLLEKNYQVDLVDNFSRGASDRDLQKILEFKKCTLINVNLLDQSLDIAKFDSNYDLIFHLAAIVGVNNVIERPYATLINNIHLTDVVIQISKIQRNLKRLVFASTSEVYAGAESINQLQIPTPESSLMVVPGFDRARTSYLLSKMVGESQCYYSTIPMTILRPHNVYGPRMGMNHVIPELLKRIYHLSEGDELIVYSPDHTRTFCYVSDAVEIIYRAAISQNTLNSVFNLGSESPEIAIRDLAKVIISVVGKNLEIRDGDIHLGSPRRRQPNVIKVTQAIDFKASVGLREGISITHDWYLKNGQLNL